MAGPYYVDPAATGTADGLSWTNAWTSIQTAFDTANAGEIVYMRGTQTFGAATTIDIDTKSGTNAGGFIKYIGCNASGNVDGTTRFVLDINSKDCNGVTNNGQDMLWFQNIDFRNAGGTTKSGVTLTTGFSAGCVWINCSFHGNSGSGLNCTGNDSVNTYIQCCFYSNTGHGVYNPVGVFYFCSFHDNTSDNINSLTGRVYNSIVYDAGDDNIDVLNPGPHIINTVVDGQNTSGDDGIFCQNATTLAHTLIMGSRITNHSGSTDIGLNCNSEPTVTGWNYFENNSDANIQNDSLHYFIPTAANATTNVEDQSNTNQGYTSLTNDAQNFNLVSGVSIFSTKITIPVT